MTPQEKMEEEIAMAAVQNLTMHCRCLGLPMIVVVGLPRDKEPPSVIRSCSGILRADRNLTQIAQILTAYIDEIRSGKIEPMQKEGS